MTLKHELRRLFVAVVNEAVIDVLERGSNAKDAEQWVLSEDANC